MAKKKGQNGKQWSTKNCTEKLGFSNLQSSIRYDLVNRYRVSASQMTRDMFVCRHHNASFPNLSLITGFVTRWVRHVEQELLILSEHLSSPSPRFKRGLICSIFSFLILDYIVNQHIGGGGIFFLLLHTSSGVQRPSRKQNCHICVKVEVNSMLQNINIVP